MYFLISIRHTFLKNRALTKILNYCKVEKIELIYEVYNGKILLDSGDIRTFLENMEECSNIVEMQKINRFTDIYEIFNNKKYSSFAVRANIENSMKYNRIIGSLICRSNRELRVDLNDPEVLLHLEKLGNRWYYFLDINDHVS